MKGIAKRFGSFLLCLLFNLVMDLGWSIPAWILLAFHHLRGISIWWFVVALALWIFNNVFWMEVIGWVGRCADTPSPPQENKNPYSSKMRMSSKDNGLK